MTLNFTLVADGSSDKTLLQIIKWSLDDLFPQLSNNGNFADFRNLNNPPKKADIKAQIDFAQKYYPFDILIYHRDAEKKEKDIIEIRKNEILSIESLDGKVVCIIPIVMMEAWLLFDATAIKKAAGNRNFSGDFALPELKNFETEPDPKLKLQQLLKKASGLKGRNLDKFNVSQAVHLVAENIHNFSPLRTLNAFKIFEEDLKEAVNSFLKNKE
jgi:hypothetical protein